MAQIAIVGGGIAGLAAAHELHRLCPDVVVTVLEGSAHVGGKLRTLGIDGCPVEAGAESFLARRPEAVELARAVGMGEQLVPPATTAAGLVIGSRVRPLPRRTVFGVPGDLRALAGSGTVSPRGVARVGLDLVLPRTDIGLDVSVGDYVRRRLGREIVDRLVDPLLGGVYAGRADGLSVAATMPELARRARRVRSLLRAAAELTTRAAPSGPVFMSVLGGLGTFAEAVARSSAATVRTGVTVRELARRPDGGWRLVLGSTRDPELFDVDGVVLAVPATPAARLLRAAAPYAASEIEPIDYASVALVTLVYPREPAVAGSGFLVPPLERRLIKAVTFFSRKWPQLGRLGCVVRASVGRYGETVDLQRDDDDLVAAVAGELARLCGLGQPVLTRLTRWGGALPQYAVGHLDRVARVRAEVRLRAPGVALAGAAYDGVGIPACIGSGQRAASEVLAAITRR